MSSTLISNLLTASWETVYMLAISTFFAVAIGLPVGIILVVTDKKHILENIWLNQTLGWVVNALRSTPFIILLVAITPFTRIIVGTTIGTTASIVPLTIASAPFFARLVEVSLKEIEWGVVEAAISIGATPWQLITKVLLPEAVPSLVLAVTNVLVNLVGYTAMAGAIGGGGLGDLAIRYGYYRFEPEVMLATVVILIAAVQIFQSIGDWTAKKLSKK
ncbi:MAG: methionine ABC transporter permease [bacterium]